MNDQQYFPGIRKPSTDFGAVRNQLQSRPFYIDVDLSTARSLAAGTQLVLPISGNFFYIDQRPSSGVAYVHFEDIAPGSTPVAVPFTQISIENVAQAGLSIRIIYGTDVNFIPSNAAGVSVLNSISVVDGGQAVTDSGKSFYGFAGQGAVAAQYPMCEIFNPVASTKNVYVKKLLILSTTSTSPVEIRTHNAALATLYGTGTNKNLSGAVSVAEMRAATSAAPPGTRIALLGSAVLKVTMQLAFEKPIKLPPGYGLLVAGGDVLTDCYTSFDFDEL